MLHKSEGVRRGRPLSIQVYKGTVLVHHIHRVVTKGRVWGISITWVWDTPETKERVLSRFLVRPFLSPSWLSYAFITIISFLYPSHVWEKENGTGKEIERQTFINFPSFPTCHHFTYSFLFSFLCSAFSLGIMQIGKINSNPLQPHIQSTTEQDDWISIQFNQQFWGGTQLNGTTEDTTAYRYRASTVHPSNDSRK